MRSRSMFSRLIGRDRRRGQRYWCNTSIRIFFGSSHVDGRGIRISESGMSLFVVADLRVGSRIELEFSSPAFGELVRLPACVRNRAVYLYGIEFTEAFAQTAAAD